MTAIYSTLTELLQERKKLTGTGVTFIEAGAKEVVLPYSELYDSAISALSFLQSQGLRPKDELVFQIEDNRTFVIVFWACILGGIVPVPLAIGRNDDHKQKLFNIWPLLKNPFLIISSDNLFQMGAFAQQQGLESLFAVIGKKMINEADLFSSNGYGEIYKADENDIAFVQFSSGSTGAPKGVMLTHKNLLTNVRAISAAANYSKEDSMLSWMPLTHDMGLIGFHINPLFSAMDHYLMPPALFVRRPSLWLDKATGHKATILCAPNFGYEYLMRHCNVVSGQYDWDLRSVRLLYNGAEPISESICRNFLHQLSKYGLKSNAMCPVYGLAEASLAVSISGLDNEVESLALSRNQLQTGARIRLIATGEEHSATFVNVGEPINDCLLRIADEDNKEMSEEIIGYIQIKGDNVAAGYYNNASATQQTITEDGWLKTGDLGFLRNGCLYITGRAKDILFSNGENYYA
ncbi:MAG: AMP-binding protein, partial [Niastella sp.]|uniref:AMP-binding protein n=1 Tax=Niastella sp. TaxID=1869183 RepID=UPI00389B1717